MDSGSIGLLVTLICLILLSGFFSGTETAFSCSSKIKLKAFHQQGNKRAGNVLKLAEEKFDKFITTILIGNNLVNIGSSAIGTILFAKLIVYEAIATVVSTAVITIVVLIFGEITPKFIAKTYPEKIAMFCYPLVMFFYYIFTPLNVFFSGWKWLVKKVFRLKADDVITEEEIITMVEEAEEDGTIKKDETKLIRSVIDFDDLEVQDIFVPRVNLVAISVDTPLEEIIRVFKDEGYSRVPVYKNSIDTIIGILHGKDFYSAYITGKVNIADLVHPAYYTTEHIKISNLLKQLQKNKAQMAIVLDEYGGTTGIVTLEDVLEELVGEIYDEHDEELAYIKEIEKNIYTIDGDSPLHEFFEYFELDEKENYDATTFSGWVIEYLGEIPQVGKKFTFKNLNFEVTKATIKRVHRVKVTVIPPDNEDEE